VQRTVDHALDSGGVLVTVGSEQVTASGAGRQVRRYTHVWADDGGGLRLLARHASAAMADPSVVTDA
jgi:hypothetical protein